jgi:hypothetical protein
MRIQTPYDENYGTCAYTHAWLRIMHETVDPDEVTVILGITPSRVQRRGDPNQGKPGQLLSKGGWILSTEDVLGSKDARHHLNWILERVSGKNAEFAQLHSRGYLVDLCVRWDSVNGHGGPTISPPQMKALADLEIELWFDVYVGELKA